MQRILPLIRLCRARSPVRAKSNEMPPEIRAAFCGLYVFNQVNQNIRDRSDSQFSGIQNQVIIGTGTPVHTGIVIVMTPAVLVMSADNCISFVRIVTVVFDRTFDTEIEVCRNKDAEQTRMVAENIISTAPDENGRAVFVCELGDDFALCQEYIILRQSFCLTVG